MITYLVFSLGGYMKPKIPKASGEARCVWFTNLSVTVYYAARWVKTLANRGFFYRVACSFVKTTAGLN